MRQIAFKSIRGRLTFWFLFLALTPLIVGVLITFSQRKKAIEEETFNKLIFIRDLKVQRLENWIDERLGDLNVMAGDYEIRGLEEIFEKKEKSAEDIEKINAARELLNRNQRNYDDYEEIFIVGANTGLIELSSNTSYEGVNKANDLYFTIPLERNEIYIKGIYYSRSLGRPQMTFSMPIRCLEHNEHILGILVIRINLEKSLYNFLDDRVGLGETGETLIVNEDVIALNELRWYDNAPLNLKIKAEPAINAAQGNTGIVTTVDYREEEILAAYTHIPRLGWGFVCKQDLEELNAPIVALMRDFTFLILISSFVITIIVLWIIKRISKPILNMNIATQKIRYGDYSIKVDVSSHDELASLADSINDMTDSIKLKDSIQKGVTNISKTMITQSTIPGFGSEILKQLMEVTNATMSTFYILNEVNSEYEYLTSIGANKELLSAFKVENAEGEFGNVLSKKSIYYLRNIPDDTTFKYITTAGAAIPKEIISIPVLVEETVVAIISLVNIRKFDKGIYDILEQSWFGINTSYSNLLANERTRIFAEQLSQTNQHLESQTEELQEQSEELQNQTEELQRTSSELQEQNIELGAQRKQVEAANKLKSEFLSNMSHELRTPLNSIMALSQVLIMQTKNKLNKEESGYLEIVERNGKKLLALINSILDLSKIEAGKMEVLAKFISLNSVLKTAKENLQSLAVEKGLNLNLSIPEDLPQIETDELKLNQILTNIIGNAVKFTTKGSVDISVIHDSENVYIEVKDSGVGISKEMLPYVFDEFRQADGTSSRQFEGTGLGLAIANKTVLILGGNIQVKSKLGKGSVFTITLPIKWHEDLLFAESFAFRDNLSLSMDKTIMVVDDDPKITKAISEYLNEVGYHTIIASSGTEALKLAEEHQPFAITLDIIMPEMDGWEVLQNLKANENTKDIPVIIVSVSNDRDTGIALGAVEFINKPIDKNLLISEIYKLRNAPNTVMIVDDNDFERNQMAQIIEAENINTILVGGGKECIKLLKNKIPDILVLDLMMPGMDGFEVLDQIRKEAITRDLPVIVVTAKDLTAKDKTKLSGQISSILAKSDTTAQDLHSEIKRIIRALDKSQRHAISEKGTHKAQILMVEDNPDAIIQVKTVLENENYKIDIASGGQEALDYLKHTIPDGIILDLMMPDIDGFEVLDKLRGTKVTKNLPVLILTAKDLTRKDLARLSANNIQQLIHKGDVDIKGLIHKVKLMLSNVPVTRITQHATRNSIVRPKTKEKGAKPNILIAEDNPDNMITLKAILKDSYDILEAIDGELGLALALSKLPDLILLDMALPKMSGEEIIKILSGNNETKNIPVIAVTAQAMKGDKEKFIAAGCKGYVSKPIDQELLLAEIRGLLRK